MSFVIIQTFGPSTSLAVSNDKQRLQILFHSQRSSEVPRKEIHSVKGHVVLEPDLKSREI